MAIKWKKVVKVKFKENLSAKIASIIFSYIMAVVLVISVIATAIMGYYKFYFSDLDILKEEILTVMAENEANHIANYLDSDSYLQKYYRDKNVFYRITYTDKEETITNYNSEEFIAYATTESYLYDRILVGEKYGEEIWETIETKVADVEVYIAKDMHKNDLFSAVAKIVEIGYSMRYAMVFIVLISLAIFIYLLCFLYCAAGHRSGGVIKCNNLDLLPFDLLTAIVVMIAVFSIIAIGEFVYDMVDAVFLVTIIGTIDYFVALGYTMSFATRIKTRTLFKNCIITYILKFISKHLKRFFNWLKFVFGGFSLLQKTWVVALVIVALSFLFTVIVSNYWYRGQELFIIGMIIVTAIVILLLIYLALILQKIKSGGEKIASGDLQHKIDTQYMFADFKDFAESLNNINEGLQSAINDKMKSERFKTELITNVSHDIKTPLTSIINYVDLIKKEKTENENIKNYVSVLDRQSGRLKKLVEDLVEASKASSGVLPVDFAMCNVNVLLQQTVGEFEEKLNKRNIKPVLSLGEESLKILADGRHLWRVFDNIMNNICKYALEGTRAYISAEKIGNKVSITFRNVSKYELNVTADELMERFVRGDKSRNTEGSGLGLSIAKSLTELQNGEFQMKIDGDLFKVTLLFDCLQST